ncbi:MAG: hypothetical protein V4679_23425 [Pseudomonadota bacterium]
MMVMVRLMRALPGDSRGPARLRRMTVIYLHWARCIIKPKKDIQCSGVTAFPKGIEAMQ